MKAFLLLTFLVSFLQSADAANYASVKKFGMVVGCKEISREGVQISVHPDFCKIKNYMLVDWDQGGKCRGFDHYEHATATLNADVCRARVGVFYSTNMARTGCYEYTPRGIALRKVNLNPCN